MTPDQFQLTDSLFPPHIRPTIWPESSGGRDLHNKACFYNVFGWLRRHHRSSCGVGIVFYAGVPMPIQHAWCIEDGKVYDPTLGGAETSKCIYAGIEIDGGYVLSTLTPVSLFAATQELIYWHYHRDHTRAEALIAHAIRNQVVLTVDT